MYCPVCCVESEKTIAYKGGKVCPDCGCFIKMPMVNSNEKSGKVKAKWFIVPIIIIVIAAFVFIIVNVGSNYSESAKIVDLSNEKIVGSWEIKYILSDSIRSGYQSTSGNIHFWSDGTVDISVTSEYLVFDGIWTTYNDYYDYDNGSGMDDYYVVDIGLPEPCLVSPYEDYDGGDAVMILIDDITLVAYR